jgi:hypothetical protein
MISAIGTVIFWMTAFVGAYIALFVGTLLLAGVATLAWQILRIAAAVIVAPFKLLGYILDLFFDALYAVIAAAFRLAIWPLAALSRLTIRTEGNGIPAGMTPEQRRLWANRRGPYRDA